MKDYKLSEIKAICMEYVNKISGCHKCPFYGSCAEMFGSSIPSDWQIDEEEQDSDGE